MKKKHIANLIMVALILVIVAAGVLCVGTIQGWFDAHDGTYATLNGIRGVVHLERDGVAYAAADGVVLRSGDKLSCNPGASVTLQVAQGNIVLSGGTKLQVQNAAADGFSAEVRTGEVFVNTLSATAFTFENNTAEIGNAAALLSVRSGAQTVSVFSGTVGEAKTGETLNWLNGEKSVGKLSIQSLNDFAITQLRNANKTASMCFTDEQLDKLEADRWAERLDAEPVTDATEPLPTEPQPTEPITEPATEPATQETEPTVEETEPTIQQTQPTVGETEPTIRETEPTVEKTEPTLEETEPTTEPATQPPTEETQPTQPEYDGYCTITIRCDTILDNWEDLDPAKAGYVPANGMILPAIKVGFHEGETVFDVLNRVCKTYGIQIEYSWTPMYDSYYIEGINHLYEFDCGFESGWMYKVNGWFPNYGCSAYTLQGEESIVWCYTCKGLGADVGGEGMNK